MPTLNELKNKWFIDVTREGGFPPQTRHPGAMVGPYTDGNKLEPLIDGAALMAEFHEQLEMMINSEDPSQWTLYISAMNIQPVKLLGEKNSAKDAMTKILDAAEAGVHVYYLGSGHAGADKISADFAKKLMKFGSQGAGDKRFPPFAGQHQKFTVAQGPDNSWLATLGSADFFKTNWDTPDHLAENPNRPKGAGAVHNVSMRIQGPAIHDIALTFAERWNDKSTSNRTVPEISSTIDTDFMNTPIPPQGTHSVQLLRNYGIQSKPGESYSWSDVSEFTIWASYLNAIKNAEKYIYIEDQYLYPFRFDPVMEHSEDQARFADIYFQLGEALKRGVDVILLVPGRDDAFYKHYEFQHRGIGAEYLNHISEDQPGAGRFVFSKLHVEGKDPVVHAKVMLVDDELALVGSTNVALRSMALCSEIHMAIIDQKNELARDLRLQLWGEHMGLEDFSSILDPDRAVDAYRQIAEAETGHLRLLPMKRLDLKISYGRVWDEAIDPYRGPDPDK